MHAAGQASRVARQRADNKRQSKAAMAGAGGASMAPRGSRRRGSLLLTSLAVIGVLIAMLWLMMKLSNGS